VAGGWAKDGAVQDQIDASIEEAVERARQQLKQAGSASARTQADCEDCGLPIPAARLKALPHALVCVDCQNERDEADRVSGQSASYNRRGSKDSQLR